MPTVGAAAEAGRRRCRGVLGRTGQQRVDAPVHGLRERAGRSAAIAATSRPGAPLARVGAERRRRRRPGRSPAARRAGPRRPASRSSRVSSSSRNEPRSVCSVSSRASATATSVRAAIAATCRYSPASSAARAEQQHRPELVAAGGDRHLGRHLRRALGLAARQPRAPRSARTAPSLARARPAAARSPRRAPRRGAAAISATRSSPSPASTAPTISRWAPRGVRIGRGVADSRRQVTAR